MFVVLGIIFLIACWFLRTILIYILVAAIITLIVQPFERRLERVRIKKKKIPRSLRAFIVLFGVYIVLIGILAVFVPVIVSEVKIISGVDQAQLSKSMHEPITQLETAFQQMQTSAQTQTFEQFIQEKISALLGVAQVSSITNSIVSIVSSLFIGFLVVSFFTFFFLKDGPVIVGMLMLLVPKKFQRQTHTVFEDAKHMLSKYFTGVLLDVLFVTIFVASGMAILGIKNALIIGLFAGIMNIIPYVGPLIGGAFAIVVGVSTNLHLEFYSGLMPLAGKIGLVFLLMNLVDGFLVQPYIFSNTVKAHPVEIFTVILIAGTLFGIGGMIAAVPTYTVLRVIAKEFFGKNRFVQRLTDDLDEATEAAREPDNEHIEFPET